MRRRKDESEKTGCPVIAEALMGLRRGLDCSADFVAHFRLAARGAAIVTGEVL